MSTSSGNYGLIYADGEIVAEIRSWEIEEQGATVDDTVMGDDWETHRFVRGSWTAGCRALWDPVDIGQEALPIGASIGMAFYPAGDDDAGAPVAMGYATVMRRATRATHDGMVEAAFQLKGNDILAPAGLMGPFGTLHDLIANDLWTEA